MLVHHSDSETDCVSGAFRLDSVPLKDNIALSGVLVAEQDLHQGTFSGAVLTHQGMDLAFPDGKADILIGHDTVGVDLCDMFHFQDLFAHIDPPSL